MTNKLKNAKNLYMEGIRDGQVREAVTKYTGNRYTQHSTGVADGIEGFVAFFEPFVKRSTKRDIRIVRAFEDGQYVFCHAYQDINNGEAKWVTADIFDTDSNDKIIEHWDIIQAFEEESTSSRSMVDGPTEVEDLEKTDTNKALVQAFYDEVLIGGQLDKVSEFISEQQYDQHNPYIEDGIAGFHKHIKTCAETGSIPKDFKLHRLIGQGNFVAALSYARVSDEDWAFIDLYRLKDDMIVEHWDIKEKILPQSEWGNSGKF